MKQSNKILDRLRRRFFREDERRSPSPEQDPFFYIGESSNTQRDRPEAGFRTIIDESLKAWRDDPLARRIVNLTTQFSIGRGFRITADDQESDAFLHEFWEHPLNRMDDRLSEWSDELCRTGNLFIMISSDVSGMSYVRAIPASQIEEIVPMPNDIEQPVLFRLREPEPGNVMKFPKEVTVRAASLSDAGPEEQMLHFTVNRPIGGQWGEPDLAPLLLWIARYHEWLEDRIMLNHYRSCFIYTVKAHAQSDQNRLQRQMQLNRVPPKPGTIMVIPADEQWEVMHPNLESAEANEDGLALKKMIAAGAGIPVSFLGESSSSLKSENGGMEDAACRNFRHRQQTLMYITETILRHVLARGARIRRGLNASCEIHIYGDDIASPGLNEGGIVRGV